MEQRYRDYPASTSTHSRTNTVGTPIPGQSPLARSFQTPSPSLGGPAMDPQRAATPYRGGLPPGVVAPHLMGKRAETGSIFREAVWPPPSQSSLLVDPITSAASAVDLSNIVDDVMGRSTTSPPQAATAAAHGLPPPMRPRGGNGSVSSLVGADPFASMSSLVTTVSAAPPRLPSDAYHSRDTTDASATSSSPLLQRSTPAPVLDSLPPPNPTRFSTVPGSPMPPPGFGPLVVTNAVGPMELKSPEATLSPASPLGLSIQPRNWLQRSPKKISRDVRASIDETGVDVTEVSSSGHSIGQAV
ncbi:uncharacterized protein BXZ73DRAFT_50005 [Epithele typhae]|uniref:uncharacterized protein n=1 Tax=Epithele typhae TaxID=378194 RepID=UPI0020080A12|nr:uncharacterized protein BXZ73DRAFT_50005 [Epithele typhae]KAH9925382.1 hypothetical protein BXZ73DRAFT_50005 [Epithele typhae]